MENWKGYLAEADELPPGFRAKMAELFVNYKFPTSPEFEIAKTELESLPPDVDPKLREKAKEKLHDITLGLKREAEEELNKLITSLSPELRDEAKKALKNIAKSLKQKDKDEQDRVAATTLGPEQSVLGPGDIEI